MLKTQLDRNYSQIKRICCLDAVRAYTTDKETDSDLIEIARQLSFSIPPVRQVNISGASSSNRGISGRSNASGSGYMSSLTQVVKVVSQEKRKLFESESPENLMVRNE